MPFFSSVSGSYGANTKAQKRKFIATGGSVTTYIFNNKRYTAHTFNSSSNIVFIYVSRPVDYIIVGAGGGGGGAGFGGDGAGSGAGNGGSAGIFASGTFTPLIQSYGITVGNGGGGGGFRGTGATGGSSSFNSITCNGGVGGGWAGGFGANGSPGDGSNSVSTVSGSSVTYSQPGPGGIFSAPDSHGINGPTPGSGGGGGNGQNEQGNANGGSGANGIVIIRYEI
jgi:hypothetical protein